MRPDRKYLYLHELYNYYVEKLLKENPEYWTQPNRSINLKYGFIYTKKNGKIIKVMTFQRWKAILAAYTIDMREAVVNNEQPYLSKKLGQLQVIRIERTHRNKKVNWGETNKVPKKWSEQKQKMVPEYIIYYTDDHYCRIKWKKPDKKLSRKVRNLQNYVFKPSEGNNGNGFMGLMSRSIQSDPLLQYQYPYAPLKRKKKTECTITVPV